MVKGLGIRLEVTGKLSESTYKKDKEKELYEILNSYSTINKSMESKLITLSDLFQVFTEDNCKLIISMDKKLDSIYFENELIKHSELIALAVKLALNKRK